MFRISKLILGSAVAVLLLTVSNSAYAAEELEILSARQAELPLLGIELTLSKVLDTGTGESYRLVLDASNRSVDYDDLLRRERELRYARFGSMQPQLAGIVELGEAPTVPVLIRFAVAEEEWIDKSEIASYDQLQDVVWEARQIERSVARRAAELFESTVGESARLGGSPVVQSGPFFSVELALDKVRDLAWDPRVVFIGLDRKEQKPDYPTIPDSLPTTRTDAVHDAGYEGTGVKIAVLERGGLNFPGDCFNIEGTQDSGATAKPHLTKSAGIIGNRYDSTSGTCSGLWQGYAPDASILLANGADYTAAFEWAKDQVANIVTMSWHDPDEETGDSLHARDVYFDYWVTRYPWPTVFTSAGNQAPDAYASGKGYNFFGVANVVNDGDGDRSNDVIRETSSWKNPFSPVGDRELPEIASPGSWHALLGGSFGGTSAATPVTAAIAALLMDQDSSLEIWPEAIRAILLATANYQDADGMVWSTSLDGKDGTGLTNAFLASKAAATRESGTTGWSRAHDYGTMKKYDFSGEFFDKSWTACVPSPGVRVRIAITWNSKVSATGTTPTGSELDADLDLWVYDPNGQLVATSLSWDNNYEFVEFTPDLAGEYTIKIRGYSVPEDFRSYYGVAWTIHWD